jgi:hypothetical protein
MKLIPVSQLETLFGGDRVAPGAGTLPLVSRDYPDSSGLTVYYPGGSATLGDLNDRAQHAGPMGIAMSGGSRKIRSVLRSRKQRRRRTLRRSNRKNKRFR